MAADFGIAEDDFTLLDNPWAADPDVYFIFGGLLAADALSRLDGFRLFSLGDPGRLMQGSIAEGVVRKATCPVLTIRANVQTPNPA